MMIQMPFRAYLIRISHPLRALRDLAIIKSRLKELRALFNKFSYLRRVAHDAAKRQRFTERIIVMLLTVDAIDSRIHARIRALLKKLEGDLEELERTVEPTWTKLVVPLEKIFDRLSVVWGLVNHLKAVKDSSELRSAIEEVQRRRLSDVVQHLPFLLQTDYGVDKENEYMGDNAKEKRERSCRWENISESIKGKVKAKASECV
ncbi:hypothetical protein C1H46_016183 [Malus baccata]|uniref:Oligopeptidase A N-terminal domain-containing protein n=1 Tax=Malus baccata TaxID=106549 RepID=A0A540MIE5_MALBA|nr:hypothetical protein C1H46_016183 [Malus baccata]